jgi:hypothetical protein
MESFEWRTLARTCEALHDLPAAARAAAKDESPLAPVEMIRIQLMMGRVDEALYTLRRFLIQNRNEGRAYTPTWSTESMEGGLRAYLERPRFGSRVQREEIYSGLAGVPFAASEFTALLRAAPPGRRDVPGLVRGLSSAAQGRAEVEAAHWASLLEAHRQDGLNAKDRLLLLALTAQDPGRMPGRLEPCLQEILLHSDPDDEENLDILAHVFDLLGREDEACRILAWLLARDLSIPRNRWRDAKPFERLERYAALLPEGEGEVRKLRWLRALDPGPLDGLHDAFDALRLEAWIALGEPGKVDERAERIRALLEEDDSAGTFRQVKTSLANWYARSGRFGAFDGIVKDLLHTYPEDPAAEVPLDARHVLPDAADMSHPGLYLDALLTGIDLHRAAGVIDRAAAVRTACLAGIWCLENEREAEAIKVIHQARAWSGPHGEEGLWIADLAWAAGRPAEALEIETALLESDRLPVPRIPALLEAVAAREGREAAERLARRAAAYSGHPGILEWLEDE